MAYRSIWESDGVTWEFSGDLTNDDFACRSSELFEDHRFGTIRYQICDFRAIAEVMVDADIVQLSARLDAEQSRRNPHVKIAIIGVRQVVFGLKRMYETYHQLADGKWACRIFNNEDDARAWVAETDCCESLQPPG